MKTNPVFCAVAACVFAMAAGARDVSGLMPPAADERPYGAVPSASQLSRDEMDIISIIHFGINTFTDQEWGFGGEDPAKFDPGDVDFDLMMRQAKDAGIDGIIFVAKHHDGFCLWPTKTTEYNITKSPYKGGKGDMVRDAIDAARRQGLRTAVYCSPWDRNTALYGKPEYISMFREQVKELLTGYGEMFEMWFDGANGGDGWYGGAKEHRWIDRTTYYDWPTTWKMVHEIHPTACIESDVGPDIRWGGNEMGFGGPECWAAYDPKSFQPGKVAMPGDCQNVRDAFLGTRNGKTWMPAEFDVSLRPGWFYHPAEDGRAKDPEHLMDIYFSSTGNGGMMNIGLQPDRKGRIHPDDVKKLKTFGDELEKMLSNDFAMDAEARRTDDGVDLTFKEEVEFNVIRLMEDCRYGQRIDDFAVDYFDGEWKPFAKGQAVGIRRLLRREKTVKATKVRLRIVHCEMTPLLKDFSVMRCGLKRNAWFKDFEKRSFSKDRTIEGRHVKIDLDPNVGKGRYRTDADGDGFRISAFDEECAQAAVRELCAKLRGGSAAAPRSRILENGGTGPYKAVMTEVPGFAEHTVFRPMDMSPFNPDKPLPVLVWGNGACANSPIEHAKFLNEIASHGYLVLATGIFPETDEPYRGPMSRPEQQIESIDWAFAAQDGAAGDEYCGRIDVKKICIAGMSCGGLQALHNCADPRIAAVMICNSGLFSDPSKAMPNMPMPRKEKLQELHSPVIYILGGEPDIAYGNGMDDFHRINHVPAMAANLPVGHGGTYGHPHGGEFAVVARIWLDWQLKGDAEAAKMFTGSDCGLARRPGWTIERNALAEDVVEIKAAQHPDGRGGLMLKIRTNGGEWRDAAGRGRVFAHSNLGNWGEKNLLDPVLYHDDDGTWHVYYKDRPEGGKDCHAVSWGKDNLTDWGRQNWVDNDLDRERLKKARAGSGIWWLTKEQVEKLGKSEWHPGAPWHFTLDSAKDDEQRYGEAVRAAKPGLRLKFAKKPAYPISRNLIGVFFEDINSSHEVYSANHAGMHKVHGFRKDIFQALDALKPRFVRFPGGCIVHARDFKSMYHWKETVGPLSERKGKPNFNWGGFQDFALGYYEYFQLCEDLGADALPILPAGVTCPNPQIAMTDAELDQLVADTLDLVEFANGDPKRSKWAKLRADMGHPKPFGLKYIGLGNEEDVNDYFERGFTRIYKAVRDKYPQIKIVGTAGPSCGGRDYEEGWRLAKRLKVDIVDEHYYVGPGWYYGNQLFYDDYDRNGPKVYAGEYAAHKEGRVNDMETALALAIHLTNLERNGDIVEMASYAPLFAKKGAIRWSPDLIYFTDTEVELTTDYWVQWIFGNYGGEKYVPHDLEIVLPDGSVGIKARTADGSPRMGALGPDDSQRFYNRFSSSVVRRGKTTIVKLVNSTAFPMPFAADLSRLGVVKGTKARMLEFKGAYDERKAKPESAELLIGPQVERVLPPYSLTLLAF